MVYKSLSFPLWYSQELIDLNVLIIKDIMENFQDLRIFINLAVSARVCNVQTIRNGLVGLLEMEK